MKAGIFPLNPESINQSRVLQNVSSTHISSVNNHDNNNQKNNPSSSVSFDLSDDDSNVTNDQCPINDIASSSQPFFSVFTT
ncbi:unnamed protein product, partial [Rotaria sp. Silwood1]